MALNTILVFITTAVIIRAIPKSEIRRWIILLASLITIFWLQPGLSYRYFDFVLPVFAILIAMSGWLYITPKEKRWKNENVITLVVIACAVLLINLTRLFSVKGIITPSRPPQFWITGSILVLFGIGTILFRGKGQGHRGVYLVFFGILVGLLLLLKSPFLQTGFIDLIGIRKATVSSPIQWLGFSYISFRILHTLLDCRAKRIKDINLQEYMIYVFFFPTVVAGPIDRVQRFKKDLHRDIKFLDIDEISQSVWRIFLGVFKKYAIADTLALIAINQNLVWQVTEARWMLVFLYAYSFQIFFDFSGYTDIAIGIGGLLGFKLPENFSHPYLKPNLKLFWDNWHMTLTQWFRTYFFNPISRQLRRKHRKLHVAWMVLIMQVSTMLLIGLWHGVTFNFILWGLWHGIGLFLQNRLSSWMSPKLEKIEKSWIKTAYNLAGTVFTFHFVMLGWIWFAMPELNDAFHVFQVLF